MYNEKKCTLCGTCYRNCPKKAIIIESSKLKIKREMCIKCRQCAENCPADAIFFSGEKKSISDIMKIVLRDKEYYDTSAGGVTVSGGEPFVQFEVLYSLLLECRKNNIHTAIETAGDVQWNEMERTISLVDLFLFDLKHIDPEEIVKVTKGNGYNIQSNLQKLAQVDASKIILRIPIIPGFNYKEEVIKEMISFAEKLNISEVNLLPYHTLGKFKYEQLGKVYPMDGASMLDKKELQKYVDMYRHHKIKVKIGG